MIYPSSPSIARTIPKHGLKATQRDLRRYLSLISNLRNLPSAKPLPSTFKIPPEQLDRTAPRPEDEDSNSLLSNFTSSSSTFSRSSTVESTPLAVIAYTSFIWWASAGEKKSGLVDDEEEERGEEEQDRALLLTTMDDDNGGARRLQEDEEEEGGGGEGRGDDSDGPLTKEMAIVSYFHRLTGLIFATVSDAISRVDGEGFRRGEGDGENGDSGDETPTGEERAVERLGLVRSESPTDVEEVQKADEAEEENEEQQAGREDDEEDDETQPLLPSSLHPTDTNENHEHDHHDDQDDDEDDQPTVEITTHDMTQMGLDIWSSADRSFVEELVMLWWGRRVVVRGGGSSVVDGGFCS